MRDIDTVFAALQQSPFRRHFRLHGKELQYLQAKGLPLVLDHAADFIAKRLTPACPANDGNRRLGGGIRYSLPNMPQPPAVAAVWKNGMAFRAAKS